MVRGPTRYRAESGEVLSPLVSTIQLETSFDEESRTCTGLSSPSRLKERDKCSLPRPVSRSNTKDLSCSKLTTTISSFLQEARRRIQRRRRSKKTLFFLCSQV
jgi:hypothetical protein